MERKKHSIFIVCFLAVCCTFAQNPGTYRLYVDVIDPSPPDTKGLFKAKDTFKDTLALHQELNEIILSLYERSYLSASIDTIVRDSNTFRAKLIIGHQFRWALLRPGNVDEEILSRTGYRDKFFNRSEFSYRQLVRLFERIVRLYENNGYPFARVSLDSIELEGNEVKAALRLEKYRFIKIDTVEIFGDPKISHHYLYNYLSVRPGDAYNEESIRRIGTRVRELPFLGESQPHQVAFTETNTILKLFLEKKNANRFDGIVGVLPDDEDGSIELTGDVKLRLQNSFRRGELIDLNWRKLVNKSQDLKLKFNYPYLFNTPFGVDFDFKLYRRDTLFLDIYTKYGVQYSWRANNYFEVFVDRRNSSLLSTVPYRNTTVLPPFADIRSTLYGFELNLERLNYRLNPKRGYAVMLEAETGTKKIRRNNDLNPIIYENLKLNSLIYNFRCDVDFYFPVSKVMVINIGNQSAYMYNENIFTNELFRIGGLKILRGFDEESIFASMYVVNTLEYRILLEQNSYWYLFFDGAYYENDAITQERKVTDTPYGFGTGITFQTKSGIFSLNYALGKQFDNPILFRAAKIHFGFVNYF